MHVAVGVLLAHNIVPEADGSKGDKAEVDGLQVSPLLYRVVHGGSAHGHYHGPQHQNEHDPVHGGLPRVKLVVLGDLRRPAATGVLDLVDQPFAFEVTLVNGPQDEGQESDDALQEQVEEEDGAGAPEEAVEDEDDLPGSCPRRGHAKPWNEKNRRLESWNEVEDSWNQPQDDLK